MSTCDELSKVVLGLPVWFGYNAPDCLCPIDRNNPVCLRHAQAARDLWRDAPIYHQLAWETDLHWASPEPHLLFWQHRTYPDWWFGDTVRDPNPALDHTRLKEDHR